MQDKTLLKYQGCFLDWLTQYHRVYLKDNDVLHKLQYLKDKLTEYIYETTIDGSCLKNINSDFLGTRFYSVPFPHVK
ncbi:hypothetical protein FJZ31_31780 [Candidatus Poribacteria bacterium]|nr:hypothetical protein [Candidatus Poribacteria bacterium]